MTPRVENKPAKHTEADARQAAMEAALAPPADLLFTAADERLMSKVLAQAEALEARFGEGCPQANALVAKLNDTIERRWARRLGL